MAGSECGWSYGKRRKGLPSHIYSSVMCMSERPAMKGTSGLPLDQWVQSTGR